MILRSSNILQIFLGDVKIGSRPRFATKDIFNLPVILLDLDPLLLNTPEHNQTKNKKNLNI